MGVLRFAFPISYVFFVVLLAGTLILFDSLSLTEDWALALVYPATVAAFLTFVAQPLYEWARLSPVQKSLIRPRHMIYYVVLAVVMIFAPIGLACPVLNLDEDITFVVMAISVALFVVNTFMLLFAEYFVDDGREL